MYSLKNLITRSRALARGMVLSSKLTLVSCLALFAGLLALNHSAVANHQGQPIRVDDPIRLHAPWSESEFDGVRYPKTYCRSRDDGLPSDCQSVGHEGHPVVGFWAGVDFFTHYRDGKDTGSRGGWPVLAAHAGIIEFQSTSQCGEQVRVRDDFFGIRTLYVHVDLQTGLGEGDAVHPADIIARVSEECEVPHLMFVVEKNVNGNWRRIDLRDVKLDGQSIFGDIVWDSTNRGANPGKLWGAAITAQAGLTHALAGAKNDANDQFGRTLATGDFNGDGKADLAIGVPGEDYSNATDAGIVIVFYGSTNGLLPVTRWERIGQGYAEADVKSGDRFGSSLAVGNFNGDQQSGRPLMDLAIGVPGEDHDGATDAGIVTVFYGAPHGLIEPVTRWERLGQKRVGGANESGDQFGFALATGDFDGDGKDDLAVGTPFEDIESKANAGAVYIFYGGTGGLLQTSAGASAVLYSILAFKTSRRPPGRDRPRNSLLSRQNLTILRRDQR